MKREIKFRAWHKPSGRIYDIHTLHWNGKGEVIGGYLHTELNEEIAFKIEDVKLLQYTGLKDKNGKEIYEGDIYRYADDAPKVIEFENGIFGYRIFNRIHPLFFGQTENKHEVIGNIYENPELL